MPQSITVTCSKLIVSSLLLAVTVALTQGLVTPLSQPVFAEKYQSRLNNLILKKNDVFLPTRLVIGQETVFVVKAPAGSHVKVFISPQNAGYQLPNGTELHVGTQAEELSGVIPETGVLQLKMTLPKDESMADKTVYVDAVIGDSDETLAPMELVDSSGRRTSNNALAIVKPSDAGSMSIMPSMPGISPQMVNQLTTLTNMQGNSKQLIDNGDINQDRASDRNPFIYRGSQQGLMPGH